MPILRRSEEGFSKMILRNFILCLLCLIFGSISTAFGFIFDGERNGFVRYESLKICENSFITFSFTSSNGNLPLFSITRRGPPLLSFGGTESTNRFLLTAIIDNGSIVVEQHSSSTINSGTSTHLTAVPLSTVHDVRIDFLPAGLKITLDGTSNALIRDNQMVGSWMELVIGGYTDSWLPQRPEDQYFSGRIINTLFRSCDCLEYSPRILAVSQNVDASEENVCSGDISPCGEKCLCLLTREPHQGKTCSCRNVECLIGLEKVTYSVPMDATDVNSKVINPNNLDVRIIGRPQLMPGHTKLALKLAPRDYLQIDPSSFNNHCFTDMAYCRQGFGISLWFKILRSTMNSKRILLSSSQPHQEKINQPVFHLSWENGDVVCKVTDSVLNQWTAKLKGLTSTAWYHIRCSFDGKKSLYLSVDNRYQSTKYSTKSQQTSPIDSVAQKLVVAKQVFGSSTVIVDDLVLIPYFRRSFASTGWRRGNERPQADFHGDVVLKPTYQMTGESGVKFDMSNILGKNEKYDKTKAETIEFEIDLSRTRYNRYEDKVLLLHCKKISEGDDSDNDQPPALMLGIVNNKMTVYTEDGKQLVSRDVRSDINSVSLKLSSTRRSSLQLLELKLNGYSKSIYVDLPTGILYASELYVGGGPKDTADIPQFTSQKFNKYYSGKISKLSYTDGKKNYMLIYPGMAHESPSATLDRLIFGRVYFDYLNGEDDGDETKSVQLVFPGSYISYDDGANMYFENEITVAIKFRATQNGILCAFIEKSPNQPKYVIVSLQNSIIQLTANRRSKEVITQTSFIDGKLYIIELKFSLATSRQLNIRLSGLPGQGKDESLSVRIPINSDWGSFPATFYIGGVPPDFVTSRTDRGELIATDSLRGCIEEVLYNDASIDLKSSASSNAVAGCSSSLCERAVSICLNGAQCSEKVSSTAVAISSVPDVGPCTCHFTSYNGLRCQTKAKIIDFVKDTFVYSLKSFITFANVISYRSKESTWSIRFRTANDQEMALLRFDDSRAQTLLQIFLKDGVLYSATKYSNTLRKVAFQTIGRQRMVDDGPYLNDYRWHTVQLKFIGQSVHVVLDNAYNSTISLGQNPSGIWKVSVGQASSSGRRFVGHLENLFLDSIPLFETAIDLPSSGLVSHPSWPNGASIKSLRVIYRSRPKALTALYNKDAVRTFMSRDSYYQHGSQVGISRDTLKILFFFKTIDKNGLILFFQDTRNSKGFIAFELYERKLYFHVFVYSSTDTGRNPGNTQALPTGYLNDNVFHFVAVETVWDRNVNAHVYLIQVDDKTFRFNFKNQLSESITTMYRLSVGGASADDFQRIQDPSATTFRQIRSRRGFRGCFAGLRVNRRDGINDEIVPSVSMENFEDTRVEAIASGCKGYRFCEADTCYKRAKCEERNGSFACNCALTAYQGIVCDIPALPTYYFPNDGGRTREAVGVYWFGSNYPYQSTEVLVFGVKIFKGTRNGVILRIETTTLGDYYEFVLEDGYLVVHPYIRGRLDRDAARSLRFGNAKINDKKLYDIKLERQGADVVVFVDNTTSRRYNRWELRRIQPFLISLGGRFNWQCLKDSSYCGINSTTTGVMIGGLTYNSIEITKTDNSVKLLNNINDLSLYKLFRWYDPRAMLSKDGFYHRRKKSHWKRHSKRSLNRPSGESSPPPELGKFCKPGKFCWVKFKEVNFAKLDLGQIIPNFVKRKHDREEMSVTFLTQKDGLIWLLEKKHYFVMYLGLQDGDLVLYIDWMDKLEPDKLVITCSACPGGKYSDNKYHSVNVLRENEYIRIVVDNKKQPGFVPRNRLHLLDEGSIYLAGITNPSEKTKFSRNFEGYMREATLRGNAAAGNFDLLALAFNNKTSPWVIVQGTVEFDTGKTTPIGPTQSPSTYKPVYFKEKVYIDSRSGDSYPESVAFIKLLDRDDFSVKNKKRVELNYKTYDDRATLLHIAFYNRQGRYLDQYVTAEVFDGKLYCVSNADDTNAPRPQATRKLISGLPVNDNMKRTVEISFVERPSFLQIYCSQGNGTSIEIGAISNTNTGKIFLGGIPVDRSNKPSSSPPWDDWQYKGFRGAFVQLKKGQTALDLDSLLKNQRHRSPLNDFTDYIGTEIFSPVKVCGNDVCGRGKCIQNAMNYTCDCTGTPNTGLNCKDAAPIGHFYGDYNFKWKGLIGDEYTKTHINDIVVEFKTSYPGGAIWSLRGRDGSNLQYMTLSLSPSKRLVLTTKFKDRLPEQQFVTDQMRDLVLNNDQWHTVEIRRRADTINFIVDKVNVLQKQNLKELQNLDANDFYFTINDVIIGGDGLPEKNFIGQIRRLLLNGKDFLTDPPESRYTPSKPDKGDPELPDDVLPPTTKGGIRKIAPSPPFVNTITDSNKNPNEFGQIDTVDLRDDLGVQIGFKTNQPDGVMMVIFENQNNNWISFEIEGSRFRLKGPNGQSYYSSRFKVNDGEWHRVFIYRVSNPSSNDLQTYIQLDNGAIQMIPSNAPFPRSGSRVSVSVGGYPSSLGVRGKPGFVGCLGSLRLSAEKEEDYFRKLLLDNSDGSFQKNCDYDPCDTWPCNNPNAERCEALVPRFTRKCHCKTGYTGESCETEIGGGCERLRCLNGGTCRTDKDGFPYCDCPHPYKGYKCQTKPEVDPCDPNPCRNGGICKKSIRGVFECSCVDGYRGRTCEDDPCAGKSCSGNGNCHRMGSYPYWECRCFPGYIGNICKTAAQDPCNPNPCKHGECSRDPTDIRRAQCTCYVPVITGNKCDELPESIEVGPKKRGVFFYVFKNDERKTLETEAENFTFIFQASQAYVDKDQTLLYFGPIPLDKKDRRGINQNRGDKYTLVLTRNGNLQLRRTDYGGNQMVTPIIAKRGVNFLDTNPHVIVLRRDTKHRGKADIGIFVDGDKTDFSPRIGDRPMNGVKLLIIGGEFDKINGSIIRPFYGHYAGIKYAVRETYTGSWDERLSGNFTDLFKPQPGDDRGNPIPPKVILIGSVSERQKPSHGVGYRPSERGEPTDETAPVDQLEFGVKNDKGVSIVVDGNLSTVMDRDEEPSDNEVLDLSFKLPADNSRETRLIWAGDYPLYKLILYKVGDKLTLTKIPKEADGTVRRNNPIDIVSIRTPGIDTLDDNNPHRVLIVRRKARGSKNPVIGINLDLGPWNMEKLSGRSDVGPLIDRNARYYIGGAPRSTLAFTGGLIDKNMKGKLLNLAMYGDKKTKGGVNFIGIACPNPVNGKTKPGVVIYGYPHEDCKQKSKTEFSDSITVDKTKGFFKFPVFPRERIGGAGRYNPLNITFVMRCVEEDGVVLSIIDPDKFYFLVELGIGEKIWVRYAHHGQIYSDRELDIRSEQLTKGGWNQIKLLFTEENFSFTVEPYKEPRAARVRRSVNQSPSIASADLAFTPRSRQKRYLDDISGFSLSIGYNPELEDLRGKYRPIASKNFLGNIRRFTINEDEVNLFDKFLAYEKKLQEKGNAARSRVRRAIEGNKAILNETKSPSVACTEQPCSNGAYCNQQWTSENTICECWTTSFTNLENKCRDKAPVQAFNNSGYMEARFKASRAVHTMNYATHLRVKTPPPRDAIIAKFVYKEGDLFLKFIAPKDAKGDGVLQAYFIVPRGNERIDSKPPEGLEMDGTDWTTISVVLTLNSFSIKLNSIKSGKSPTSLRTKRATRNDELVITLPSVGVTPEKIVLGTEANGMPDYKGKENNFIGWMQNLFVAYYNPPTFYDLMSFAKDPNSHQKTGNDFEIRTFPDPGFRPPDDEEVPIRFFTLNFKTPEAMITRSGRYYSFDGKSFSIDVKPESTDGVILYLEGRNKGEYGSLYLIDSYLYFLHSSRTDPIRLSDKQIDTTTKDKWYSVKYSSTDGFSVNGIRADGNIAELPLNSQLYLGSASNSILGGNQLGRHTKRPRKGYVGCTSNLMADDKYVVFSEKDIRDASNVESGCKDICTDWNEESFPALDSPCLNSGYCLAGKCQCEMTTYGPMQNQIGFKEDRCNKLSQAFHFGKDHDGTAGYFLFKDSSSDTSSYLDQWSFAFKTDSEDNSDTPVITRVESDLNDNFYQFYLNDDGELVFQYKFDKQTQTINTGKTVNDKKYHTVRLYGDYHTDELRVYLDGKPVKGIERLPKKGKFGKPLVIQMGALLKELKKNTEYGEGSKFYSGIVGGVYWNGVYPVVVGQTASRKDAAGNEWKWLGVGVAPPANDWNLGSSGMGQAHVIGIGAPYGVAVAAAGGVVGGLAPLWWVPWAIILPIIMFLIALLWALWRCCFYGACPLGGYPLAAKARTLFATGTKAIHTTSYHSVAAAAAGGGGATMKSMSTANGYYADNVFAEAKEKTVMSGTQTLASAAVQTDMNERQYMTDDMGYSSGADSNYKRTTNITENYDIRKNYTIDARYNNTQQDGQYLGAGTGTLGGGGLSRDTRYNTISSQQSYQFEQMAQAGAGGGGDFQGTYQFPEEIKVESYLLTSNGRYVVTASSVGPPQLWDMRTGELICIMGGENVSCTDLHLACRDTILIGQVSTIDQTGTLPSGKLINQRKIQFWDVQSGRLINTTHDLFCTAICMMSNGEHVVFGRTDQNGTTVTVWDVQHNQLIREINSSWSLGEADAICYLALSHDDRYAIAGFVNSTDQMANFVIFDLSQGIVEASVLVLDAFPECTAVMPNHEACTGTKRGELVIWNIRTAKPLRQLMMSSGGSQMAGTVNRFGADGDLPHDGEVKALSISRDYRYLVSAGSDCTLKIWEMESESYIRTLFAHTDEVWCCYVSNDNDMVVSGSRDNTIRLWRMRSGNQICSFNTLNDIFSVKLSNDKKIIVALGDKFGARKLIMLQVVHTRAKKH